MTPTTHIWATPVFSGKTAEDERVVLYKDRESMIDKFHIKRPDGEVWALSHGSELVWYVDRVTEVHYLTLVSPEWSGSAKGTWVEVIEEESLRR